MFKKNLAFRFCFLKAIFVYSLKFPAHLGTYFLLAGAAGFEPTRWRIKVRCLTAWLRPKKMVERTGFEPVKAVPADLQSAPFGQLGNLSKKQWSRRWDSNPQPADYKSAALPIELRVGMVAELTGFEPAISGVTGRHVKRYTTAPQIWQPMVSNYL